MIAFIRLLCLSLALLCGAGTALTVGMTAPAAAQDTISDSDYDEWKRTAKRADEAIEAGRASTDALETLRSQISDWRQRFVGAQDIHGNAIATVKSQIDTLGPRPEEGEEEAASITSQRERLEERLAELQEPVRAAQIALTRADGLIRGIDTIIRDRQAEALLDFGPSPINPMNWQAGWSALTSTMFTVRSEFSMAWNNPVQRAEARNDLPKVLAWLLIGIVLVMKGRRWGQRMSNWALTDEPGAGYWILSFALSTSSLALPFFGVLLLAEAALATNLVGLRGEYMITATLGPIFVYLLARWLATRIFPSREARTLPLNLEPGQRASGRFYGASLGAVAAAFFYLTDVAEFSNWPEQAHVVVVFPFIVLAGLMLLRLARLMQVHCREEIEASGGVETFRTAVTKFLALALVVLGVVSPVLAAVGYFKLAHFLLFPSLLSLQLLGVLLVLQRLIVEAYVLVTRNREGAEQSLVPVLIGLVLVAMSLPVFALAWGARPAQLWDMWTRFTEGVEVGGVHVSPGVFFTFIIVFIMGYFATRLLQGTLKSTILPKTRLDQGGRNAVVSGVGYMGILLAALIAITSAGLNLSSIAIVAGALSVGIGFGLRTIVENFVSGIILLIERPISEGDWIEVGGVHGTVRDISVRSTRIETFDRSDVIVPNADLVAGRVTNYTRFNTVGRVIVPVRVAFGSDTRKIEKILGEIAEAHPMVLANPAPAVVFRNFGEDSLEFEIRAILRDVNWVLAVASDMNHEISRRFTEAGIEIPVSQRDIRIRNPEALAQGGGSDGSGGGAQPAEQADLVETVKPNANEMEEGRIDGEGAGDGDGR